ncbi:MAG: MBOAT family O-acyltransferase [Candidatus Pacebacteria bacterium]|nr:MBOAT family O-acyltransferase [Candidatus Paceibacterota bacterium]
MIIAGLQVKSKYYVGFKLSEAAVAASGQSFNGCNRETGEPQFNRIYLIDITSIELDVFGRRHAQEWNHHVHIWLKDYVYQKIVQTSIVSGYALSLTFLASATWHGFYPIYYVAFMLYSIGSQNCYLILKTFAHFKWLRRPWFHLLSLYGSSMNTYIACSYTFRSATCWPFSTCSRCQELWHSTQGYTGSSCSQPSCAF